MSTITSCYLQRQPITANFFHQLCFNLKIKWNEVTDQLLIFFHISVTGIPPKEHALPKKQSEFQITTIGIVQRIEFFKEPDGVYCQNPGQFASTDILKLMNNNCIICSHNGLSVKSRQHEWRLPKLFKLTTTCQIFVVVFVSRSSSYKPIPEKVFENLRKTVAENEKYLIITIFLLQQH